MSFSSSPDLQPFPKPPTPGSQMTVIDHLAELRRRFLVSFLAVAVGVLAGFCLSIPAIGWLQALAPAAVTFVQLGPGEVLMASCKLAVLMGLALASPVVLDQLLRFILPGLTPREKALVAWIVGGGFLLFLTGVAFAYYAVLPPSLGWLLDYGQQVAALQMSVVRYVDFCMGLLLLTGAMFELPMVLFFLSWTGLVTSQKMLAQWRMATIIIFLVSAVVTPSQDPFSMVLVGAAMTALYLLSIIPIRLCGR